jgi:hypothetical protein
MTNPPVMEIPAEKSQTNNNISGDGRILIMMEGTIKMPLPITVPITIPRQERRLSL